MANIKEWAIWVISNVYYNFGRQLRFAGLKIMKNLISIVIHTEETVT